MEMSREEWLAKRREGITGTDIAAICGLNPYVSPAQVWQEKLGLIEIPENPMMEWGKRLEAVVAQKFAENHGVRLKPGSFIAINPSGIILCGTNDFWIEDAEEGLEVKTASTYAKGWGDGPEEIPPHYFVQCHWYMILTGFKVWHLAALIGGNDYREYKLQSHPGLQNALIQKAQNFWTRYVVPKVMPPADATDSYRDIVSLHIPKQKMDPVLADDEMETIAANIAEHRAEHEKHEELKKLWEAKLLEALKARNANACMNERFKATFLEQAGRKSTDWKALARDLNISEDTIAKYEKVGNPFRVFRFSYKGKENE
jgi:putative phage-type endonuclease